MKRLPIIAASALFAGFLAACGDDAVDDTAPPPAGEPAPMDDPAAPPAGEPAPMDDPASPPPAMD